MHSRYPTAILASALLACSPGSDVSSDATTAASSQGPNTTTESPTTSTTTGTTDTTGPTDTTATTQTPTSAPTTDPTGDPVTTDAPDPTTTSGTDTDPATDCADLPLCDGFEADAAGAAPDPTRWTVASPNCAGTGTLAVSDQQAHGGARSLRVDGGGGYCDHVFIATSDAVASLGPQVHARFFVRFESALGQGHVTFLTLRDSADNGKDLRMGGQSEIAMWNRESDDATLPSLSPAGIALSIKPTPQQWTCVELMIDQTAGTLTTWVDDQEITGLMVDGEPTPDVDQQWLNKAWKPVLEDIKLGWESYAGQSMVLYFDDIALAAARIGCDG